MKVWINGTFDIVHRGHLELLKFASQYGTLRVGIDGDKRVKELKGNDRPINNINERVALMESLKWVDSVVTFNSNIELENHIRNWNPDYLIIGDDYKDKKIIGSEFAKNIVFFDKINGYSTTLKINQINGRHN